RTLNSASEVTALNQVKSRATRSPRKEASKPSSVSAVVSGPRSGLPTFAGVKPGAPPHPTGDQGRTTSKAPGARPACPYAARSLSEPRASLQKGSSDTTHEPLTLG